MILEFIKAGQKHIRLALFAFSAVLAVVMVSRAVACRVGKTKIPAAIKSAAVKGTLDDEGAKKYLAKYTECADKLKKRNMFTSPPSKPKPPSCTGIIGDRAIINGKSYKVGEKVAGAEVVSIGIKDITILWDGKEKTLEAFSAPNPSQPSQPKKGPKPPSPPVENASVPVQTAPQAQPVGAEMSPEERMERRRRFMEARGRMGGGRQGGRRGGGRRGQDGQRRGPRGDRNRQQSDGSN